MQTTKIFCALVCAATVAGCTAPEQPGGLGVRVSHLTADGPQAGLPEEADTLRFLVMDGDRLVRDFSRSVVGLEDLDGDGADDVEAAVEIPPDTDLSITVFASLNVRVLATGRVDGLRVTNGGRRFVDLTFSPVRDVSILPAELPSGRFGHATALTGPDGRVLITGGFDTASPTSCPAALGGSEACFRLEASDEAFLVDPASGALLETHRPMFSPRALHTATSLEDGRVLVAGGVDAAIMGIERLESSADGSVELRPRIVPLAEQGFEGALRTFELFDPLLLAEEEDSDRNGDPQAGDFIGSPAAPGEPGRMNSARYLHAAAALPGDPSPGVLVVGGQGAGDAAVTGEVFLTRRPGGSGFTFPPPRLVGGSVRRVWPGATTTEENVFVMGGVYGPTSSNQLGEIWEPGLEPGLGTFAGLETCQGFTEADRANNGLVGPATALFGRAERRVLVAGWAGPLCDVGAPSPETWHGSEPCAESTFSGRAFTIGVDECTIGRLQDAGAHWLGGAAAVPTGGAILAGGFSDGLLSVTDRLEVLSGEFNDATHLAERLASLDLRLTRGRAWLTATTLLGGRVLLAGGMNFVYDGSGQGITDIDFSPLLELYDPGYDPSAQPAEE